MQLVTTNPGDQALEQRNADLEARLRQISSLLRERIRRTTELEARGRALAELIDLQDARLQMLELVDRPHDVLTVEVWRCVEHDSAQRDDGQHIRMVVEQIDGRRWKKDWFVHGDGGVGTTWICTTEPCP